jgi:hypothetical protein
MLCFVKDFFSYLVLERANKKTESNRVISMKKGTILQSHPVDVRHRLSSLPCKLKAALRTILQVIVWERSL